MKKKFITPKITKTKIKVNFFLTDRRSDSRDQYEDFMNLAWSNTCTDTCFIQGTQVLMSDGSTQPIESIKLNENVRSYNVIGEKFSQNKVSKVIERVYPKGYILINKTLKETPNHLIWVNDTEWKRAEDIQIGDKLISPNSEHIEVKSIKLVKGIYTVYNIHLDGNEHNYFADNVLVHNTLCS
jgi:hypothetical protein